MGITLKTAAPSTSSSTSSSGISFISNNNPCTDRYEIEYSLSGGDSYKMISYTDTISTTFVQDTAIFTFHNFYQHGGNVPFSNKDGDAYIGYLASSRYKVNSFVVKGSDGVSATYYLTGNKNTIYVKPNVHYDITPSFEKDTTYEYYDTVQPIAKLITITPASSNSSVEKPLIKETEYNSTYKSYYYKLENTQVPLAELSYRTWNFPLVPQAYYTSTYYGTSDPSYGGFKYGLYDGNSSTLAEGWSNSSGTSATFTLTDASRLTYKSYAAVIPYFYTRFKYPSTIDRFVKCVNVISYFRNDEKSTSYVQNGSIDMASSTSKAGTTDVFTAMPNKCVVYGSPAYLQVSLVPSDKNDEKYITKVNIHAYAGDTFQGTVTMNTSRYTTYKYHYVQQGAAYTFTFDIVTRQPKLNIVKKNKAISGVSWTFNGGGLSKTLTTNTGGEATADINNEKSKYAAINVKSLSMPEAYRCLRPSIIYFSSNDFTDESYSLSILGNTDYRDFTYAIGGSSIQQYNYDITASAYFNQTEKIVTYVTAYGGTWYVNVPNFNVNVKTSVSYSYGFDYVSSYGNPQYFEFAYLTSLQIAKYVTITPSATGYAYIGNVIVSKAEKDGSNKTALVSFTAEPKDTAEFLTAVSEKSIPSTSYVTYIDVMVCGYQYPVCFATNAVGQYSVNVNNQTVKVTGFDKNTSITPITYAENINLSWANPDNNAYELEDYKIYQYKYDNVEHTGSYNYKLINTGLTTNVPYRLTDFLDNGSLTNISPCDIFVIEPRFKVTEAPAEVTIISNYVANKEYDITIGNINKHVGSSNVTVTSMKETESVTMGTVKPSARQYSWNSGSSIISYTNTGGTSVTKVGIKENDVIKKPSDLSGTLSKIAITPVFTTKTTYNISFERYHETGSTGAPTPNYPTIKWYDNYTSGAASLSSYNQYVMLDTLLPSGGSFGIESITLDDKNYEIEKIKSTADNGKTWTNRTLGKSNGWTITANTTVMPVIKQATKEMHLNFLPVSESDYTVVYSVDGVAQSSLYVGKSSSGVSTVTFQSSSKIIFKSITFESVEYSLNEIIINNTKYSLNKESSFYNPSANYYDVTVTAKADYSKINYKLNINAQNWTNNISGHFKYDVILSDEYFNLETEMPAGADSINASYVTIDSTYYNNIATMTIGVTYTGKGVPTSPNVDIMFYVDTNTYNYRIKPNGYSPFTASYTNSNDYNWTVPVSKAFEMNSQKSISYIVQVSATKYNFRGTFVPYDVKNQKSIVTNTTPFGVEVGKKTTYTLADPETVGISPENYGIMVSKPQIEVNSNVWQDCKYKLSLSPTTIPVVKSYATLSIFNNHNYNGSVTHKVSVKVNGVNAFDNTNNEVVLACLTQISIPYKLNNPSKTTLSISITSASDKSFGLFTSMDSSSCFVNSDTSTGVLQYSVDIAPNKSIEPTFFIKHV